MTAALRQSYTRRLSIAVQALTFVAVVALLVYLGIDIVRGPGLASGSGYRKANLAVCVLMVIDLFIQIGVVRKFRLTTSDRIQLVIYLLLAVPWLNIALWQHWHLTMVEHILLCMLPLLRGITVLASMAANISGRLLTGAFTGYIALMGVSIGISSILFYAVEFGRNPAVTDYWQALWWAVMNLTTAGCYVVEYTPVGKFLAVLLSGIGIMLFPVFTVYITNAVNRGVKKNK